MYAKNWNFGQSRHPQNNNEKCSKLKETSTAGANGNASSNHSRSVPNAHLNEEMAEFPQRGNGNIQSPKRTVT